MARLIAVALSALAGVTSALNLTVSSEAGNATSALQYGIMFEDINHSGDGGLYAELVRNRAFQGSAVFPSTLEGWFPVGNTGLALQNLSDPVSSALPTSMRVSLNGSSSGQVGFGNTGWWGINVKQQDYDGSFWVKGGYEGSFIASLQSDLTNETYGSVEIPATGSSSGWTQYNYTLCPDTAAPNANNSLLITFDAAGVTGGSLDFNLISLFPPTYKDTPNGNRIDLMEALAGLNPTFLRMPGGNNIEGNEPPYHWYWNRTIGPLVDRPGRPGTWTYENTDGQGLIEYLEWCRDLNMEPILGVWAGFYLEGPVVPQDELQPYIDSALNELEFLMGDANTTYGAMRAALGHDAFQINYVEVGNEDNLGGGAASYSTYRFPMFRDAILAAYPHMTVIASTVVLDPFPANSPGDYHQYTRPDMFVDQFSFFDNFTSEHPTLIGEYAIVQPNKPSGGGVNWTEPQSPFPFWIGTVAEAIFLLGAERNADKIMGAAYAPLFQNLNNFQWTPDLISFTADTSETVLSTSYHMLKLFGGTHITETRAVSGGDFGPAYWVAGATDGGFAMKAAVYNSSEPVAMGVAFPGAQAGKKANLTVLTAEDAYAYNGLNTGNAVKSDVSEMTAGEDGVFAFELPELSIALLETGSEGEGKEHEKGWGGKHWQGGEGWMHGGRWKGGRQWRV